MECSVLDWTTLVLSSGNMVAQVDHKKTFVCHYIMNMFIYTELYKW